MLGLCRKAVALWNVTMQTPSMYIAGQRLEWIVIFTKSLEMDDLVLAFQNSLQGRAFCPAAGTTVSCHLLQGLPLL